MISRISNLLNLCGSEDSVMPPTILYNEGWILRIILDWYSHQNINDHPLSFTKDARWYSEILLPSPFLPRFQKDPLSETYTHADGAIGHFTVGKSGKGDINLSPNSNQLVIIEAKMFSKLSKGIKNFPEYDQATRNIACIAEVLKRSDFSIDNIQKLGFFVIAPEKQLECEPTFESYLLKNNIKDKVLARVLEYKGDTDEHKRVKWYNHWFIPVIEKINIDTISWEQIIDRLMPFDPDFGIHLIEFYKKCIEYNQSYKIVQQTNNILNFLD